ncbi:oxygen tolerance protein BatD [Oceanihabitans sediminis]|uniref:Protein BatD n=1 Tax=Oceanihabitans sediminis TaxID=1812012 RepID=A0A368P9H4_9FLAO|nr:BatD family protein [Oceanihabitans sediminis]RBP34794.1 oxygen tolerance protein BatD [Oceanihabitans sediminis]RCU58439.1 protein BatD [Oceanihabitans sediminis]
MKTIKHITILFLLLATSIASAQVKFEAKVSKSELGVNERLRIDFEMNQDGDNFNPPSFQDFTVVAGPNQSVSHSWINGKKSFNKTYSYFLAPKNQGKFTINQATIEIDGEVYKTTPITVNITSAVDKPKDPNDPDVIIADNIHLVAEVSKTNPYINEAITVVYKLYVAPNTGVSNWRETSSPSYNDFWSQNIDTKGLKVLNGKYKGEDYRYVVLRKTVLYPQKTGKLEIEPLSLDITVDVPTNRRNIFGERLMTQAHKTITAGSRQIHVKALPEKNKPANFTGAVGDFDFRVTSSKTELNATESLSATVEVSGNGNLKLFELPNLNVPSSLEVYEPENKDNVRTTGSGMQGKRSQSYTIVPQFKGKYPLPSISFSYFDLKTESYKTLASDEIVIDVLQGPTNVASNENGAISPNKQTVIANNDQFAFIKTKPNLVSAKKSNFFKTTGFWTALLAPLLAIPLAIVFRNKRDERLADVTGNRIRKADRLAKKYLSEAKRALGQKEAFYVALEKALHNYLKAKLQIETSDFTKEKITETLLERQVEDHTVTEFISILKNCELARYTPITQVEMQQDYDKASKTISEIDKQIR